MPEGINPKVCDLIEQMVRDEYSGIKGYRDILNSLGSYIYDEPVREEIEKILKDEGRHGIKLFYLLNEYCGAGIGIPGEERREMMNEFHVESQE